MNEQGQGRFATTQWSLVRAAGHEISEVARAAMEKLCQMYWFPVYAYIRRKGHSSANAEDLTQAFFLHMLESDFVSSADRGRGRFRSYLLKSASHFLLSDHRYWHSQKRGAVVSICRSTSNQVNEHTNNWPLKPSRPISCLNVAGRKLFCSMSVQSCDSNTKTKIMGSCSNCLNHTSIKMHQEFPMPNLVPC